MKNNINIGVLNSIEVHCETRKLKAKWTPEFVQELTVYQNFDAEAELTALLSEQIIIEVNRKQQKSIIKRRRFRDRAIYKSVIERWIADDYN